MKQEIKPTHRHYKGGLYRLLNHARMEGDFSPVIVYQSCEDAKVWVRPLNDFREKVTDPSGTEVLRFEPIGH